MLKIKENIPKELWNSFLISNGGRFLQSYEWGEFQSSLGKKIWRLVIFQDSSIMASAQFIKDPFSFGGRSFFYIPFGPTFRKNINEEIKKESLNLILERIKELNQKEKTIFLRIEPFSDFPKNFAYKISSKRVQPQKTLILDLEKEEEKILKNFTYRVRYNIRLAEKRGVKIEIKNKYLPDFYNLMEKTAKRDKFRSFEERRYQKLFDFSSSDLKVKLLLAYYKEKIIAANILFFFNSRVTCLHGASDWEYRSLKAVALLQWEAMKMAKREGYREYDFWGVDEKKWPGLTFFKKSFGGKEVKYPKGIEIVFSRTWYFLYRIFRKIRKLF